MNDAQTWTIIISGILFVFITLSVWHNRFHQTELRYDSVSGESVVVTNPTQQQIDALTAMILAAAKADGVTVDADEDDDDEIPRGRRSR